MFGILCRRSVAPGVRCIHTTTSLGIKDYYLILAVPRDATTQQIKSAYYEKAKLHHPDASGDTDGSIRFQEIAEAYEILSDISKRRVYDTTTRGRFQDSVDKDRVVRNNDPYRSPGRPADPISMSHIRYVYQTLNKEDEPTYRQASSEYLWPGTNFSRFDYTRRWDAEVKDWVYNKRPDIKDFKARSNHAVKIVKLCVVIIILGSVVHLFNYKFFLRNLSNQSLRSSDDIARDRAGMYVIKSNDK